MNKPLKFTSVTGPLLAVFLAVPLNGCAEDSRNTSSDDVYSYTEANVDGIGKLYMGREISHVMGYRGAAWLERPSRVAEERVDLLIENLPIKMGDSVADIGAGTGYFSLPMARAVGNSGTVYAVDIQPEMLEIIASKAREVSVTNIQRILATERDPGLPAESINMALFVDAYHEFEWPREVMLAVYTSLVPGGEVVLIEYREEDPLVPIKKLHKMSEQQARREMEAIGLEFVENKDFLPQQHFLRFRKPE